MITLQQVKLPISHTKEELEKKILKTLRIKKEELLGYEIRKQSLDARKKPELFFVYTIDASVKKEETVIKKIKEKNVSITNRKKFEYPAVIEWSKASRPVITGSGPAGLFCAYYLAKAGLAPLVIERGDPVETRMEKVETFWKEGILDTESNVQFGEGGAGTFSDGKLNTLVKDPNGRNHEVLKRFVEAGAPQEIVYQQKPHLGTDVLIGIVETMRHQIEEMGGAFRFESKVTDLCMEKGRLCAVEINDKEKIPAEVCVLALGHSARDTFSMIHRRGIFMQPKSFAVGLRIEHPQKMINMDLYGEEENEALGAASYKVTHTCENGRGVYSFCMCPGGYVVNASSEEGMLAVNGMSYQACDSKNANSALIVTVSPEDFPEEGVLGGITFQRNLEKAAWELGKGRIPVQLFEDFKEHRKSTEFGEVVPQMKGAYVLADVRSILPKEIGDSIEEGVTAFGRKIKGFDRPDALLSGIESRTSSPVRIVRDRQGCANIEGIYPCGEGAGYAGGITSAAMDGIKTAEFICEKFKNF